jgi:hypothetical protein
MDRAQVYKTYVSQLHNYFMVNALDHQQHKEQRRELGHDGEMSSWES